MAAALLSAPGSSPAPLEELPAEGHSLSLEETGRILLVLELRFLMAIVSFFFFFLGGGKG